MAKPSKAHRPVRRAPQPQRHRARQHAGTGDDWVVSALAVAFLLSGGAGLIHEVVWARLLGHLFGATSMAVSTVLAAFMGGLAIGSYWIGTRSDRLPDRRRTYAMLEMGIGVLALLVPVALALVEPLYGWIWRRFHFSFAAFSVLRFLIASAILLAPTIMMGATLPVLADYLAGLRGRRLAPQWLYTANLAGAVMGVAAAGFLLMPTIGVWGTIVVGAALNVGVGVGVLRLPRPGEEPMATAEAPTEEQPHQLLLVTAFFSGFISLATQVAWTRVLALIVGSTTYAFSSVLLVYLVALAVGSAWAARRGRGTAGVGADLAVVHELVALGMLAALYSVNSLPYWYLELHDRFTPTSLGGFTALNGAMIFGVLFMPVVCAGTILPLAMIGVLRGGAHATGPAVGRIYAVNTLGAILGAILVGFVLLPLFGSQATLLGVALLAATLGIVLALWAGRPGWLPPVVVAAAVVVAIGAYRRPEWNYLELHAGVFEPGLIGGFTGGSLTEEGEQTLFQREGPTASVLVSKRGSGTRVLIINGRVNASDNPTDMVTQVLVGELPMLVAPKADDIFIVGWGSGVTAGAVVQSPARHITAVELEPAVVEASQFFAHVNHQPLRDPRLRLYEDDARHILQASDDAYDVIVSEPPHPWVTGVANLFTRDFYRIAANRLHPDGIFTQWLQGYQISFETFRSIVASLQSVFPEVLVFRLKGGSDTILVGSRQPLALDLAELERRWNVDVTRAELTRVGMTRPESLLATLYLTPSGVRSLVEGARLNTDNNMYVEFRGARDALEGRKSGARDALEAGLATYFGSVEEVLREPAALLANPERLQALITELERLERPTAA
jgi:spermidine synthase